MRRVRATLVACAALAVALAPWSPASAETDLGILAAVLAGTHVGSDNPQPDSGVAAGALLELTQRWNRFRIHLEGIPEVRVDGNSTGNYGRSSASLSIRAAIRSPPATPGPALPSTISPATVTTAIALPSLRTPMSAR